MNRSALPESDPETRIRDALRELGDALVSLAKSSPADVAPVGLLAVEAAAERLGIARSTAWEAIRAGELRTVKVRGRRLVPTTELERIARGDKPAA